MFSNRHDALRKGTTTGALPQTPRFSEGIGGNLRMLDSNTCRRQPTALTQISAGETEAGSAEEHPAKGYPAGAFDGSRSLTASRSSNELRTNTQTSTTYLTYTHSYPIHARMIERTTSQRPPLLRSNPRPTGCLVQPWLHGATGHNPKLLNGPAGHRTNSEDPKVQLRERRIGYTSEPISRDAYPGRESTYVFGTEAALRSPE